MKYLSLPLLFLSFSLCSQTTIVLQPGPGNGKDARIFNMDALANYGSDPFFIASQLDYEGEPGTMRSLMEFDLSGVPEGAGILDARLSLYYNPDGTMPGQLGDNAAYLRRLIEPWSENTVAWAEQPSWVTENQVEIPASVNPSQDYVDIDVSPLIRDILMYQNSHGFMFMLQNEQGIKSMKFYSSDAADANKRPKLVVTYTLNPVTCVTIAPGNGGNDAKLYNLGGESNFGNDPEIIAAAWTFEGQEGVMRSLMEFDLSVIPDNVVVSSAYLNLFYNTGSASPGQEGANSALLQRVTSSWSEQSVSWGTQPSTTTQNQVVLPASTTIDQDYRDINVTQLVNDMIDNPGSSFGFMLKLMTEEVFRSMRFASTDHPDPNLHPYLEVCYTATVANHEVDYVQKEVHPNPFTDVIVVEGLQGTYDLTMVDVQGKVIRAEKLEEVGESLQINDLGGLPAGVYFLYLRGENGSYYSKVVK